jgi:hypothetical protein
LFYYIPTWADCKLFLIVVNNRQKKTAAVPTAIFHGPLEENSCAPGIGSLRPEQIHRTQNAFGSFYQSGSHIESLLHFLREYCLIMNPFVFEGITWYTDFRERLKNQGKGGFHVRRNESISQNLNSDVCS